MFTTRCLTATEMNEAKGFQAVSKDATIVPFIQVIFGTKNYEPKEQPVIYDPQFARAVSYVCKGTVLTAFSCAIAPPPPTALQVAQRVAKFGAGFVEGVANEIGFKPCIHNITSSYDDGHNLVDALKEGINAKLKSAVVSAFQYAGKLVKDIAETLQRCRSAAKGFIDNLLKVCSNPSDDACNSLSILLTLLS